MFDLKQAIADAQNVVFLTGAGVSTASGIPDYRSKGGLYNDLERPEYALSADNLRDHPEDFWRWVTKNMYFPEAKPNAIHEAIASVTNQKGALITQNVDGLDQRAGVKHLIEFHGNLYRIYCQSCHKAFTAEEYLKSPYHETDRGVLRPDIVLYGEPINPAIVTASLEAIAEADLIVVVGTSLQVYPFAGLLQSARATAQIVAVNREALSLPAGAEMVVGDALEVFSQIGGQEDV